MGAKTKVICFANNKGGSGKSTTCSNVGYGLTQLGRKVLLIDGDMDSPRAERTYMKALRDRMTLQTISSTQLMKIWI